MVGKALLLVLLTISAARAQIPPRGGGSAGHLRSASSHRPPQPVVQRTHKAPRLTAGITLRVPQQFLTIQSAIDAASNGDTVLVSEGTFFENIRYRGKAIVVGSLYLTDGDTTHIDRTIIDGSQSADPDSGSVVYFIDGEDTTSVLCGFTISGGTGTFFPEPVPYAQRLGGGVLCVASGARIVRNHITRNRISDLNTSGGGLAAMNLAPNPPFLILDGNRITHNVATSAFVHGASAMSGGAGICGVSARIVGNLFERDTASAAGYACAGGLAVAAASEAGPYPEVLILSNIFRSNAAIGSGAAGNSDGGGIMVVFATAAITTNTLIDNVSAAPSFANGGGITSYHSSVRIDGNMFVRNAGTWPVGESGGGGALSIGSGSPQGGEEVVVNNLFLDNIAGYGGGAICAYEDPTVARGFVAIVNNTIAGNRAGLMGGGILLGDGGQFLMNNIFWDDVITIPHWASNEIAEVGSPGRYYNNDIKGGWRSGSGTISASPGFANSSYSLADTSQCIGLGLDSVQIDSSGGWYHAPAFDFTGSLRPNPPGFPPDIGAMESPLAFGKNQPALVPATVSVDFRNVHPGTRDTLTVRIVNRTTDVRTISSLSFRSDQYAPAPDPQFPIAVPGLHSAVIGVAFSPITPGKVVSDTLFIATDDPVRPVFRVLLTGRGSGPVQCAGAGTLFGISPAPGGPALYDLNRTSGKAGFIEQFSPSPPSGLCAFTLRQRDSTLYAAFDSPGGTDLYRLSSAYGDLEFAGTVPIGSIVSMAFDRSDVLYLMTAEGKLYRGRVGTPDTVLVGVAGHPLSGLAFSPATGMLWGSWKDSLFTIDTLTAGAVLQGVSGWGPPSSSIAFNSLGTLFGLYWDWLVIFDKVTGRVQQIGETGVPGLVALAMRTDGLTGAEEDETGPVGRWNLAQNYPNPFNPATTISYTIAGAGGQGGGHVRLVVYDLLGREVAVLVDERKVPGSYSVRLNAAGLASGVYLYKLTAGDFSKTRKLVLLH